LGGEDEAASMTLLPGRAGAGATYAMSGDRAKKKLMRCRRFCGGPWIRCTSHRRSPCRTPPGTSTRALPLNFECRETLKKLFDPARQDGSSGIQALLSPWFSDVPIYTQRIFGEKLERHFSAGAGGADPGKRRLRSSTR
jgi:hypothetical protein